jgi:putative transposase
VLLDFNGESDYVHLIIDYKPDIALSKLIANLKTVSSRLIRKEFPYLAAKYFDNKPYFWTGAYCLFAYREHLTCAMSINAYSSQKLENLEPDHKEK